jgi:hypothetical protein
MVLHFREDPIGGEMMEVDSLAGAFRSCAFLVPLVLVLNEMVLVIVIVAVSSSTSTANAEYAYEKPRGIAK